VTGRLVLENVKHRPMRSVLSALLIGVPVTLILTLVGLSHGMLDDAAARTRGIGADIFVRPKGSTAISMRSTIPAAYVDYFARQPHITGAVGALMQPVDGITLVMSGLDMPKYIAMTGGFKYVRGGPPKNPDDIVIDEYYARQRKAGVGSRIKVLNRVWHVTGIIQNGQMTHMSVDLKVLQDMLSATGQVNSIFLKLDNPDNTNEVIRELKADPKLGDDWPIYSTEEMASMWNVDNIPGLSAFIYVVMGIGVVIGFFVVCLSMYMAVLQRTREIGILKSLGASKGFILGIILLEAFVLGVAGAAVGIVLSFGANYLIGTLVPASIQMEIVPIWWPIAGGITLVGALLGAMYPGLNAAASDPIEALAYE
jgi:putative ABC transport system permease protein